MIEDASKILVLSSWQEKGFKDRILPKTSDAFFVPCIAHGLNLLLKDMVTAVLLIMILYGMI